MTTSRQHTRLGWTMNIDGGKTIPALPTSEQERSVDCDHVLPSQQPANIVAICSRRPNRCFILAVRYFVDKNRNKRLDGGETLLGEMIHTTPEYEGQTERGVPVKLDASHGCIHVAPVDRDKLHTAGAFARGTDLIIHDYKEAIPAHLK